MPELKVFKRRPYSRLPVKCSPSEITENEARSKKKKQTLAVSVMAVLFIFCSFNGYWLVNEYRKSNRIRQEKKTQRARNTRSTTNVKPKKRWSLGSFYSKVIDRDGSGETELTAETIKTVEEKMTEIVKLLPEIAKNQTTESTFKDRFALFKDFYESMSSGDQKAIFPMVTPEKLMNLFKEDSQQAGILLDRLLKRVLSLMP